MVDFLYRADYTPDRISYASVSGKEDDARRKQSPGGDEANVHGIDERVSATTIDSGNATRATTEAAESETSANVRAGNRETDASSASSSAEHDGERADSMSTGVLKLHALVYALGDKYEMPTLQRRALDKFSEDAERLEWDDRAFCSAVATAYALTLPTDRGLRNLIVEILHRHHREGEVSTIVEEQICALPDLACSLWKRGRKPSSGPSCSTYGIVEAQKCLYHMGGARNPL